LAVWRSAATDAFTQIGSIDTRASFGTLLTALGPGPSAVFDNGNTVDVELVDGVLSSVADLQLFAGSNSFAVQTDDGAWEIVQVARCRVDRSASLPAARPPTRRPW